MFLLAIVVLLAGPACAGVPGAEAAACVGPVPAPPTPERIEAARAAATQRLDAVRRLLADQAVGVVLERELGLDGIGAELQRQPADGAALWGIERSLRRIVPGRLQSAVNELREAVGRLGRMTRLAEDQAGAAAAALASIERHLADPGLRLEPAGAAELRASFAQAARLLPDEEAVASLRRRLSQPNAVSFVGRDLVAALARQHFDQPVRYRDRRDGAAIAVTGRVGVDLSASVPVSRGENLLLVHARGTGAIAATADRRRVHVRATAAPTLECTQEVHILPRTIEGDTPRVNAEFRTRLTGVGIDGLLGECRLARRVAGRAIQDALAANDPRVAATIEKEVGERVREEGIKLAYRVNGLLQHAMWDQLAALDYLPESRLHNDASGIWSEAFYAHDEELAAVSPRPALPAGARLDLVTWVHESVAGNSLGALAGATVDEATIRGLWNDQFKLTSPQWDALPGGRFPAVITLAPDDPVGLRFVRDGVELRLAATSCELDGRPADAGRRTFRIRYRIERRPDGVGFLREPIEFGTDVPAGVRPTWERVLDLFLAADIRPMQRFPNAKARQLFELGHLDVTDGWLVVGSRRLPETEAISPTAGAIAAGGSREAVR